MDMTPTFVLSDLTSVAQRAHILGHTDPEAGALRAMDLMGEAVEIYGPVLPDEICAPLSGTVAGFALLRAEQGEAEGDYLKVLTSQAVAVDATEHAASHGDPLAEYILSRNPETYSDAISAVHAWVWDNDPASGL